MQMQSRASADENPFAESRRCFDELTRELAERRRCR